jgi:hypothetical protein
MENKIQELAKEITKVWIQNYTLSGRLAFIENEKKRVTLFDEAESLGIRSEVYTLANKMMNGEA